MTARVHVLDTCHMYMCPPPLQAYLCEDGVSLCNALAVLQVGTWGDRTCACA